MESCRVCGRWGVAARCATCGYANEGVPFLLYIRGNGPARQCWGTESKEHRDDDSITAHVIFDAPDELLVFVHAVPTSIQTVLRDTQRDLTDQVFVFMDADHAPFGSMADESFRPTDWFASTEARNITAQWTDYPRAVAQAFKARLGVYVDAQAAVLFRVRRSAVAGRSTIRVVHGTTSLVRLDPNAAYPFLDATDATERLAIEASDEVDASALPRDDIDAFYRRDFGLVPDESRDPENDPCITSEVPTPTLGRAVQFASAWVHTYGPEQIKVARAYTSDAATMHGVPTPVAPPAGTESRFLEARFPDRIAARHEFVIECQVMLDERNAVVPLPLFVPPTGAAVQLLLDAEAFEFLSDISVSLAIEPGKNSGIARFHLRAPSTGTTRRLILRAYFGGILAGGLDFEVVISPGTSTTVTRRSDPAPWRPRAAGEITLDLDVQRDTSGYVYRFQWVDAGLARPETFTRTTTRSPEEYGGDILRIVKEVADGVADARWVRRKLQGVGARLWQELLPQEIRERVVATKPSAIVVNTSEHAIPFEVLHPGGDAPHLGFLAEQVPLTRWTDAPIGIPTTFRLDPAHLVAPPGAPATAGEELRTVADALQDLVAVQERLTTFDDVTTTMDRGAVGVVHFACHDTFIKSRMQFGASTYDRDTFAGGTPLTNALFFVNACYSQGMELTNIATWALSAVDRRCGAFVGPQWGTRSKTAIPFVRTFYKQIASGRPIGAAIQAARAEIRDSAGDPSWLAYSVYGDPAATL